VCVYVCCVYIYIYIYIYSIYIYIYVYIYIYIYIYRERERERSYICIAIYRYIRMHIRPLITNTGLLLFPGAPGLRSPKDGVHTCMPMSPAERSGMLSPGGGGGDPMSPGEPLIYVYMYIFYIHIRIYIYVYIYMECFLLEEGGATPCLQVR